MRHPLQNYQNISYIQSAQHPSNHHGFSIFRRLLETEAYEPLEGDLCPAGDMAPLLEKERSVSAVYWHPEK